MGEDKVDTMIRHQLTPKARAFTRARRSLLWSPPNQDEYQRPSVALRTDRGHGLDAIQTDVSTENDDTESSEDDHWCPGDSIWMKDDQCANGAVKTPVSAQSSNSSYEVVEEDKQDESDSVILMNTLGFLLDLPPPPAASQLVAHTDPPVQQVGQPVPAVRKAHPPLSPVVMKQTPVEKAQSSSHAQELPLQLTTTNDQLTPAKPVHSSVLPLNNSDKTSSNVVEKGEDGSPSPTMKLLEDAAMMLQRKLMVSKMAKRTMSAPASRSLSPLRG